MIQRRRDCCDLASKLEQLLLFLDLQQAVVLCCSSFVENNLDFFVGESLVITLWCLVRFEEEEEGVYCIIYNDFALLTMYCNSLVATVVTVTRPKNVDFDPTTTLQYR